MEIIIEIAYVLLQLLGMVALFVFMWAKEKDFQTWGYRMFVICTLLLIV